MATEDKNIKRAIENTRRKIAEYSRQVETGDLRPDIANERISVLNSFLIDLTSGNIEARDGKYFRGDKVVPLSNIVLNNDRNIYKIAQGNIPTSSQIQDVPIVDNSTIELLGNILYAPVEGIVEAGRALGQGARELGQLVQNTGYGTLPENPLPLTASTMSNTGSEASRRVAQRRRPTTPIQTLTTQSQPTQYTGGAGIGGQLLVGGGSIQTDNTQAPSVVVNNGISTQAVPASNTVTGSGVPVTNPSTTQSSPQPPRITWQVGNGVSGIEGDITAFQNMYNQYATENNLPTIDVDGVYGNETNNAVKLWNQNNPGSQVNVDGYTINQPDLNTSKNYIKAIGMDKTMGLPDSVFDPRATHVGYDKKTGKAIYANSENETIGLFRDPITNQITATNSREPNLDVFENLAKNIKANTPTITKRNDGLTDEQRKYNFSSRLGDLGDTATAIMGATIANQKIEPYERSEEYNSVMDTLRERSTQGFTAEEQSVIDNRINNRYAQDIDSITQIAGGGGNQAGVLAAMSTASRNANNSEIDAVIKGIDIQRQNESRYNNAVMNEENFDYNQYQQDLNMLMDERRMGADLISQARQNISNRRYFDNMYGPSSTYRQVQNAMINNRNRYAQQEQSSLNAYNNRINAPIELPSVQQHIQGNPIIPLGVNPLTEQRALQLDQYNFLQRGNREVSKQ